MIYYRMYGGIFHIIYLGQNSEDENSYEYKLKNDEICILEYYTDHDIETGNEVIRRRVAGYIISPTTIVNGYTLSKRVECSFEALVAFYSHMPEDAEIDEVNKTITVDFYGVKSLVNGGVSGNIKNETIYAVIRHDGESFEITL